MTSGSFRQNALRSSSRVRFAKMLSVVRVVRLRQGAARVLRVCGSMRVSAIVPGERAPGRLGECAPHPRGQSADKRWCGTPHPVARLAAKPVPSAEGNNGPVVLAFAGVGEAAMSVQCHKRKSDDVFGPLGNRRPALWNPVLKRWAIYDGSELPLTICKPSCPVFGLSQIQT